MNDKASNSEQNSQSAINSSLRLAILGSLIATIGDAISTIAAVSALDEAIISDIQDKKDKKELDDKLEKMQQQIDDLTTQLSKLQAKKE